MIQTPDSQFAALQSSPQECTLDNYRCKQMPEPYPYTNQPNVSSLHKHGELVLSTALKDEESIDDYEYLKQPFTPATEGDSEQLLEFYRNIQDSQIGHMLVKRYQEQRSFVNGTPSMQHFSDESKK